MARQKRFLKTAAAVGGMMVIYWILAATVSPRLGPTFDEPGHITSGYVYWKYGDFRINAENGMLGTRAAAVPLLNLDLMFPPREGHAWVQPNARALAGEFFFASGNDPQVMLRRARIAMGIFGVAILALVWAWARGLFGREAAWLAITVGALSPTLLAHGGLATSDVVVSCCLLAALSAYWRLWHRVTWPRLGVAGLAAGATFLAKTSGVLLVPMLAILMAVRVVRRTPLPVRLGRTTRRRKSPAAVVGTLASVSIVTAALSVGIIWTGYEFRFAAAPDTAHRRLTFDPSWPAILEGQRSGANVPDPATGLIAQGFSHAPPAAVAKTVRWLRDHRVLPEAYLWSLGFTFQASRTRPTFFLGQASSTGSFWFFPTIFLLKTTPPEWLLLTLGLAGAVVVTRGASALPTRGHRRRWLYRSAPLLVLFAVYWMVAVNTPLNIGHRHLLPVYPVVFVFAGASALWFLTRWRFVMGGLLAAAVAWQALTSITARPFYLSYFTPFLGRQPWRYFVDSSFDWGQGLPDLKTWMAAKASRGDPAPVFLSYFGSDSPRAHGLEVIRFGDWRDDMGPRNYPAPLRGGWYAISATNFQRIYLGVAGPWSPAYEQRFQELGASFPKDAAAAAKLSDGERAAWLQNAMLYEVMLLGRLCHFLRDRTPEAVLGSSLLLFRLTDEDIQRATTAPLAGLDQAKSDGAR